MMRFLSSSLLSSVVFFSVPVFAQSRKTISISEKHPESAEKIHIDGVKDAGKLSHRLIISIVACNQMSKACAR
jgi:hypothetical protein